MKRIVLYAFIMAATVVFILGPGHAKSQDKKEIRRTIIINDGDTIINGKKLSDASAAERKALLKEMDAAKQNIKERKVIRKGGKEDKEIIIRQGDKEPRVLRWRSENDDEGMNFGFNDGETRVFKFDGDSLVMAFGNDSLMKRFHFKMDGLDSNIRNRVMSMNRNFEYFPQRIEGTHPRLFMDGGGFNRMNPNRENSQIFNYESTDKDGVSSRLTIRISEPNSEERKKLNSATSEKPSLEITDLTLSPNFSNGKLSLSFGLASKGKTEVKITDTDMKPVFTDMKADFSGIYFKQISLPKNGIYFISISQGGKTFSRKLIKN